MEVGAGGPSFPEPTYCSGGRRGDPGPLPRSPQGTRARIYCLAHGAHRLPLPCRILLANRLDFPALGSYLEASTCQEQGALFVSGGS